jgi:hypothetical protein
VSFTAMTLWHLGYADQALRKIDEAVALARGPCSPIHPCLCLGARWRNPSVVEVHGCFLRPREAALQILPCHSGPRG